MERRREGFIAHKALCGVSVCLFRLSEPAVDVVAGSESFYVKEDGRQMIRIYWLDAYEDPVKHSGGKGFFPL